MARIARLKNNGELTCYHVITRTALPELPFGDVENDELTVKDNQRFSQVYFTEIFGYSLMGNHHLLLLKMIPGKYYSDDDIKKRFIEHYGDDENFLQEDIEFYRKKWSDPVELSQPKSQL